MMKTFGVKLTHSTVAVLLSSPQYCTMSFLFTNHHHYVFFLFSFDAFTELLVWCEDSAKVVPWVPEVTLAK